MTSISASENSKSRSELRRPEGRRSSLREVRLIGISAPDNDWGPGDRLRWWGRSYQVEATEAQAEWSDQVDDSARSPDSSRYLHLRPLEAEAGAAKESRAGLPIGEAMIGSKSRR